MPQVPTPCKAKGGVAASQKAFCSLSFSHSFEADSKARNCTDSSAILTVEPGSGYIRRLVIDLLSVKLGEMPIFDVSGLPSRSWRRPVPISPSFVPFTVT